MNEIDIYVTLAAAVQESQGQVFRAVFWGLAVAFPGVVCLYIGRSGIMWFGAAVWFLTGAGIAWNILH